MIFSLLSFVALVGHVAAQCSGTESIQSGEHNYVLDWFTGDAMVFAYAFNQCSSQSVVPIGYWFKYTYSMDDNGKYWATKTMYSDNMCTEGAMEIMKWSQDDYEMGEVYYFEVDGEDSYVKVSLVVGASDCSNAEVVYGGLGGCAMSSPLYNKFYCEKTMAKANLYFTNNGTALSMCSTPLFCTAWNFMEECSQVATLEGAKIYGKLEDCSVAMETTESSAKSQFAAVNIVVALAASLLFLL